MMAAVGVCSGRPNKLFKTCISTFSRYIADLLTEVLPVIAPLYILALCGDGGDVGDVTESEQ